jgi:hypothetical protein
MFSIQVLFVTVMALALATISIAEDLVWFENYTNTGRYIIFTPNSPSHSIGDIYLPPGSSSNPGRTTVHFNNLGLGSNKVIFLSPPYPLSLPLTNFSQVPAGRETSRS